MSKLITLDPIDLSAVDGYDFNLFTFDQTPRNLNQCIFKQFQIFGKIASICNLFNM